MDIASVRWLHEFCPPGLACVAYEIAAALEVCPPFTLERDLADGGFKQWDRVSKSDQAGLMSRRFVLHSDRTVYNSYEELLDDFGIDATTAAPLRQMSLEEPHVTLILTSRQRHISFVAATELPAAPGP